MTVSYPNLCYNEIIIKPLHCNIVVNFCRVNAGLDKQKIQRKIVNILLPIIFNISFGCSNEPSH